LLYTNTGSHPTDLEPAGFLEDLQQESEVSALIPTRPLLLLGVPASGAEHEIERTKVETPKLTSSELERRKRGHAPGVH